MREDNLTVLVVDSGGRGHALYDAFMRSPRVKDVFVAPGNGGIPYEHRMSVNIANSNEIIQVAEHVGADIIYPGTEVPIAAGLFDACESMALDAFCPSKDAAQLEASKQFAKEVVFDAGAGTYIGRYHVTSSFTEAKAHIRDAEKTWGALPVIKANGLCGGKGVVVPDTLQEADQAAYNSLVRGTLGLAGKKILIDERFEGPECSLFYACDGENALFLGAARDYKRLSSAPGAPNTGGMGAYTPLPDIDPALPERIREHLVVPVLKTMKRGGMPYHHILYVGLMLTTAGPKLLEFNCRWGDPEAEVLLPLLGLDIVDLSLACREPGGLKHLSLPPVKKKAAVTIVACAEGYPDKVRTGDLIEGTMVHDETRGMLCYHAGTKRLDDGTLVTHGGRVFDFVGLGSTIAEARERAKANAQNVRFDGMYLREDIAQGI